MRIAVSTGIGRERLAFPVSPGRPKAAFPSFVPLVSAHSVGATPHWGARLLRVTSGSMRFPPPAVIDPSPPQGSGRTPSRTLRRRVQGAPSTESALGRLFRPVPEDYNPGRLRLTILGRTLQRLDGYPKLVGELSTKIRTKACFRGNRISGRKGFNNRTENLYPDQ